MVNIDVINCHVKPYTNNVHSEILTFCTPGSTFHHEHILESSSLVWSSFSMFCEFPGVVRYLQYPRMKVRVSSLQDKSKWLLWSHNGSLVSILPMSRSLESLLEYIGHHHQERLPAEKRQSSIQLQATNFLCKGHFAEHLCYSNMYCCLPSNIQRNC